MDGQNSGATVTFTGVRICNLADDGSSPSLKYPGSIQLIAEYDPEVRQVVILFFYKAKREIVLILFF